MPRGRPPAVDSKVIVEIVMEFKNRILSDGNNGTIVPKGDPLWEEISSKMSNKVKAASIYSYVIDNRFNLRQLLMGRNQDPANVSTNDPNVSGSSSMADSPEASSFRFVLTFAKTEFESLIIQSSRQYRDKRGVKRIRIVNILQPNKWTEIVSTKIYNDLRLVHGYHFDSSYITKDKESGGFTGHCACGSKIICKILPSLEVTGLVKVSCVSSKGNGQCGKRQCRGETRKQLISQLEKQSTVLYRTKLASDLMYEGDTSEPPHLYSGNVMRTALHQHQRDKYRHLDPMNALKILKRSPEGMYVVRNISDDPVMVQFWSPHQIRVHNILAKREHVRLCIDATGGIVKDIQHVDGQKSHHIFLYIGVMFCSSVQSIAFSLFSEKQDTVTICEWLMRWIQSGAKYPKEVVCDSSRALLNACCWAFGLFESIEAYAEACMTPTVPRIYIRIDVAHYIKNWAQFLKNEKKEIKRFYMFASGQLILCQSKNEATQIIKALLIISLCETGGDEATALKESVDFMKTLMKEETEQQKELENIVDFAMKDVERVENYEDEEEIN